MIPSNIVKINSLAKELIDEITLSGLDQWSLDLGRYRIKIKKVKRHSI